MRRSLALATAIVLTLTGVGVVDAGTDVWTSNGPPELVVALAIDPSTPSTLYAGGYGGVYQSTNSGGSWSATGLNGVPITALAIDPSTPSTLYAATYGDGVFQSTNSGGSWSAVSTGLPDSGNPVVFALAIDPSTPSTLYAGTDDRVYKTTNSGGSWSPMNNGLPGNTLILGVGAFAIDPSTPSTVYAATFGDGVFQSTNSGGSWSAVNNGLLGAAAAINALAMDPSTPSTLYVGTELGVYRSTNSGGSWSPMNNGLGLGGANSTSTLVIDPSTPSTLYIGLFGEDNSFGVYRSTNSAGIWKPLNNGLRNSNPSVFVGPYHRVFALAIDPSTPSRLYAGTDGPGGHGVFDLEVATCPAVPVMGCDGGEQNLVLLKSLQSTTRNKPKLDWAWGEGLLALSQSDFGDPESGRTSYLLCVYDESGGSPVLKFGATIFGNESFGFAAFPENFKVTGVWAPLGTSGWSYKSKSGAGDGVTKLKLKSGAAGTPRITLVAGDGRLVLPAPVSGTQFFNEDPAVIVQLSRTDAATCWSSTFMAARTRKNTGTEFKAKG